MAQDFDAGLEAANRGDFAAALKEWRPLAEAGDALAQFNLGNMYQQTGQPEKALATWQQGYALYPDNTSLADQVTLSAKNP